MRVASIALAAYLANSALRRSITRTRSWLRMKGIQRAHQQRRALVVGADYHPVGAHEVGPRGTFLQELGVQDHREGDRQAALRQLLCNRRLSAPLQTRRLLLAFALGA